ncbi:hypothetical protein DP43_5655 [Burkholderia pseudomallei]|nr:hypothetical protein DP43_5655 [Burkholderia pseudomallei]
MTGTIGRQWRARALGAAQRTAASFRPAHETHETRTRRARDTHETRASRATGAVAARRFALPRVPAAARGGVAPRQSSSSKSDSSIQCAWIASRIFSPEWSGSSSKPSRSSTHWRSSVKRIVFGSTSGCWSASAIAISRESVHFIVEPPRRQ